jgi:hypothetical protein
MSNPTAISPRPVVASREGISGHARPVSLVTIVFVGALFAAFAFLVSRYYKPTATAPQNQQAENLPKDLEWKATPASRKKTLTELREKQAKQATSYAWVDQKAGVVQLPIERAMELTAQQYGAKK